MGERNLKVCLKMENGFAGLANDLADAVLVFPAPVCYRMDEVIQMNEIGAQIRKKRGAWGFTQAELAEKLGVRYQTVSKWENGVTLPGIDILPALAEVLETSTDELLGRSSRCSRRMTEPDRELMMGHYAAAYGPEAGPWNLSVENKYLEYRFAAFFEAHFKPEPDAHICNIGIGAGAWDRYLAYQVPKGRLTSIDRDAVCCRQLELGLALEGNPCDVQVVYADVMEYQTADRFALVTVVGSTERESGQGPALLERAMELVAPGGALYYQTIDGGLDVHDAAILAGRRSMKLTAYEHDPARGFDCRYYWFLKE